VFGDAWKHVNGAYTDKEAADDDIM